MSIVIGLTGGIGSGKSTAAQVFSNLGIKVVSTDKIAREVLGPDKPAFNKLKDYLGPSILDEKGALNRAKLRKLMFSKVELKEWLEKLLHPLVNAIVTEKINEVSSNYTLLESPLLLETRQHEVTQKIIVVDISWKKQIYRTRQRDNIKSNQVKSIMV